MHFLLITIIILSQRTPLPLLLRPILKLLLFLQLQLLGSDLCLLILLLQLHRLFLAFGPARKLVPDVICFF